MAAATQPRPYRRILTSALHRRFVHASALSLLVCYVVSIAIGDKTSFFWTWFPIGPCGLRAVMIFLSVLLVFVLRVSQMHLGPRTTPSSLSTFRYLFPLQVAHTFCCYLFSAWWFTELYLWSSSKEAQLDIVKRGRSHERPLLNERPIYIHSYHLILACAQATAHLYYDYDQIPVPVTLRSTKSTDQRTHQVLPTSRYIKSALPQRIKCGLMMSVIVAGATPFLYLIFLRQSAWSLSLYFAKLFWSFSRSAAQPDTFFPPGFGPLIIRSLISGSMLVLSWQSANLFFSIFLGKEPLKRGQPLTADAKEPNASLLSGLKAKKHIVKAFALWELGLISQRQPDRRKTIFNEIDGENGSTWSQILVCAKDEIQGITKRIEAHQAPKPGAKPAGQPDGSKPELRTLPRLTDAPKDQNVFATAPKATSRHEKFGEAFGSTAKAYGQSPDWTPTARARAREVFDRASTAMLSPERKQKLLASTQELKRLTGGPSTTYKPEDVHPIIVQILQWCRPLRQTYARRASSIVFGSPESSFTAIVDAVDSLTCMLIASLDEDQYGKVQIDVPPVVSLFTQTIMTLDAFVHQGGLDAHWTDVKFPPSSQPQAQEEARKIPEVELVLDTLQSGLRDLLEAFKPYLRDIGVTGKDLRLAKEAAGIDEDEFAL
ncbi:nuclear envelope protein [Penicillium brasilianum]|uniref:Nuclear envelope protein n=1 Tax=Penicillium brasilianum TaxID=104259 RepID=A0A1S9R9Q4_PENBI|nr:nuclear envelope protein [Penicillium brasilianum]